MLNKENFSIGIIAPKVSREDLIWAQDYLAKKSKCEILESKARQKILDKVKQELLDKSITEEDVLNLERAFDLLIIIDPKLSLHDCISIGASYSEIYHVPKHPSELALVDLDEAVRNFLLRKRNFGI